MSRIFMFICCYGFYFNLIGFIEFHFFIRFYLIFYVYKSEFNIMYAVSLIYSNLSPHCFPFSYFQSMFFLSPRTMAFFTITPVGDYLFHRNYIFPYRPRVWPLVQIAVTIGNSIPSLRTFLIWRVAGWQRSMRRPPQMGMQNGQPFIIDRSSPGGGSRGGVFHKCSDIYTPPQTKIYQGMLNIYFPSQETPRRWCARACPSDTWLDGGGWGVVSWTHTLWHSYSNTPQKTRKYITCVTYPTHASPKKRQLGPSMCSNDAYVKINHMAP